MALSPEQLSTLKADIAADPALAGLENTDDAAAAIAEVYKAAASPDYWVWRSDVSEFEFTSTSGVDLSNGGAATAWSWTAYIARSLQEQNAWARLFMSGGTGQSGRTNPSRPNVRNAVADIFSGASNGAPAQRNHCLVLSKRKANRLEKLFAAGTGTFATPATMAVEGVVTYQEVRAARSLPQGFASAAALPEEPADAPKGTPAPKSSGKSRRS
jgi:hypothetical protein